MLDDKKIYKEINVELLNIVEADGLRKLALFNSENIPSLIMGGKDILPGHRAGTGVAGLVFFNTQGDECGGLIFGSDKLPDGGYRSSLSFTFDQYKNDQVVQMLCAEENYVRQYGFKIFDRPDVNLEEIIDDVAKVKEMPESPEKEKRLKELFAGSAVRMFIGKSADGSVGVNINNKEGKPTIRIYIDKEDVPHFEFIDSDGKITQKVL